MNLFIHYLNRMPCILLSLLLFMSCGDPPKPAQQTENKPHEVELLVLGTLQDGGSPQAGCSKTCCLQAYSNGAERKVVCLGLIDHKHKKRYLFEAGPDFPHQLQLLNEALGEKQKQAWPDGIFISHAHIGHYSGLMFLGKEAMNADRAKVYALPRMKAFLESNGPWDQLCKNENIRLTPVEADSVIYLSDSLSVTTLLVPHRDEYSETAGFLIRGPEHSLLFIPDIDKWEKWETNIIELIKTVDYALIDGTFFGDGEVPGRNIKEIPHPFVKESMDLFKDLEPRHKNKIQFIHFNHTNPLLDSNSSAHKNVKENGFGVARFKKKFHL